jgi:hypothetical protein
MNGVFSPCECALPPPLQDLGAGAVTLAEMPLAPGDPSICLQGGNTLALYGEPGEPVHAGLSVVKNGRWYASGSEARAYLHIIVDPADPALTRNWSVDFSLREAGKQLRVGQYPGAHRSPGVGGPGLDVSAGRGCNQTTGRFQILDIAWNGDDVARLTATFEQTCDKFVPTLRGCVHYESHLFEPFPGGQHR